MILWYAAGMARFKTVAVFLVAVLAAMYFWNFLLKSFLAHHADNAAAQGAASMMA